MNLEKRFKRKITMRSYERNLIMVITLLSTLLLLNIWPRFRSDALSVPWYAYIILIVLFVIPFLIKKRRKK